MVHWSRAVTARLREARNTTDARTALAEPLVDRPLFCDLLSHVSTSAGLPTLRDNEYLTNH